MTVTIADNEIPEDFLCPITQQVFKDPVMDMQGHTYERNAILSWLGANGTCPLSRREMKASDLIPNIMMQTRIRLWQRETGQKVFSVRPLDEFGGSGDETTENESGSENDADDMFLQSPVYAVTITRPSDQSSQRRQRSRHSTSRQSRTSRRRQRDNTEQNRSTPEPAETSPTPRRFRLFGRRGSL